MDDRFLLSHIELENLDRFTESDSDLFKLKSLPYVYKSSLLNQLPMFTPGIYSLVGSGIVGKTTLLKQWLVRMRSEGVPADSIHFFQGMMVTNIHLLIDVLKTRLLSSKAKMNLQYVLIDDVMTISHWQEIIKFILENKLQERVIFMLVSVNHSLCTVLEKSFAKDRGKAKRKDFHLYPLSFSEFCQLKHSHQSVNINELFDDFHSYLIHGGFLFAINEMKMYGKINQKVYQRYADWLNDEVTHNSKKKYFLKEILGEIIQHYCGPISWNLLSHESTINHPKTIAEYIELLQDLDVVFVQHVLQEETLTAAPKKARKLMFSDPFIYHALHAYFLSEQNPFESELKFLEDPHVYQKFVEACTVTQFKYHYPTFYIKTILGEINLAYLHDEKICPVMIDWNHHIRSKDIKLISKYPNGKILTKQHRSDMIKHIRTEPLPQALLKIGNHHNKG